MEFFIYFMMPFMGVLLALFIGSAVYVTNRDLKRLKNPSTMFGASVLSDPLMARETELRFIVRRIQSGQSSAVLGPFSQERTSLLSYLRNHANLIHLYGDKANQLIFSYIDVSSLDKNCRVAQFWEEVLKTLSLHKKFVENPQAEFSKAYQECKDNNFGNVYIDQLFEEMQKVDLRLVLMLDRFDELSHLSSVELPKIVGSLRRVASSSTPSPLVTIVAGKTTLTHFHQTVQREIGYGSPWFNFIEPGVVTLGALSDADVDQLLRHSVSPFTDKEEYRNSVKEWAGGHPYLLQIAASVLLEVYEKNVANAIETARHTFYDRVKNLLRGLLQSWSPRTCQAFLAVMQKSEISTFVNELKEFANELKELEKQGFLKNENDQWEIRPKVFLELLKDDQTQELCKKSELN